MKRKLHLGTLALLAGAIVLFLAIRPPVSPPSQPAPKPLALDAQDSIVLYAYEQVSTSYTELAAAPPSASGKPYFIGGVAVHPKNPGGSHLDPIIPFGTILYLDHPKYIEIQGRRLNAFTVIDTGDADWSLWPNSPYWIDLYFGTSGYWENKSARDYGKHPVSYYWVEEFR
ncbi:MAG: hypothetical protein ACM3QZ_07920 [Solirubrobacterales bacterium]